MRHGNRGKQNEDGDRTQEESGSGVSSEKLFERKGRIFVERPYNHCATFHSHTK
jgi:hypothetical protein